MAWLFDAGSVYGKNQILHTDFMHPRFGLLEKETGHTRGFTSVVRLAKVSISILYNQECRRLLYKRRLHFFQWPAES